MRHIVAHQTPVGNTPVAHKNTNHILLIMVSATMTPELKISEGAEIQFTAMFLGRNSSYFV
jgi:hypothetical protein